MAVVRMSAVGALSITLLTVSKECVAGSVLLASSARRPEEKQEEEEEEE